MRDMQGIKELATSWFLGQEQAFDRERAADGVPLSPWGFINWPGTQSLGNNFKKSQIGS
jgi:hypothetical protein